MVFLSKINSCISLGPNLDNKRSLPYDRNKFNLLWGPFTVLVDNECKVKLHEFKLFSNSRGNLVMDNLD